MEEHETIDGYFVNDERCDESDLEIPDEWVNFGDANPELHGGLFLRWDRDMWQLVETRHPGDLPEGFDGQYVSEYYIEPEDVWVNGNPSEGFTEEMVSEFETLTSHQQPETTWDMDNIAISIAHHFPHYMHGRTSEMDEDADYWEYLADHYDIPNPDESDSVGMY